MDWSDFMNDNKVANKLTNEKSPYLLQHAHNPVNWYPWGDEAFKKAIDEDKPIFLSIGYSTCHWCHVMEHESFEDEQVAELMNDAFVSIKVDREERPDVDSTYMSVCQIMTGSGGWPLSVIMTPQKKPFFAGTYIPKQSMGGRLGMIELVPRVQEAWSQNRDELVSAADRVTEGLNSLRMPQSDDQPGQEALDLAYNQFSQSFDSDHGGFGGAPKFPSPHNLLLLLRYHKRTGDQNALRMVEKTLTGMRRGGIYDHIGYGFHRYSTDRRWFLPHFEKMLYDQAMMALAYLEAYQATGKENYADTAREIFDYVLREMTSEEGAFYSAEDADSEGEEGKFYLFSMDEIRTILNDSEAEIARQAFNISPAGNYVEEATGQRKGTNILYRNKDLDVLASELNIAEDQLAEKLEDIRKKIFAVRQNRIHPGKDDKILTDWNGLMIAALARGAKILRDENYARSAEKAAEFIISEMRSGEKLKHRFRDGEAAIEGYLDDYAFMIWGLLELYEATFGVQYLVYARHLSDYAIAHFRDSDGGAFYMTADSAEEMINRPREFYDGAIPSGNSVMALNLLRLSRFTAESAYEQMAYEITKAAGGGLSQQPVGFSFMLCAVDFMLGPSYEIVITEGLENSAGEMLSAINRKYLPNSVVLFRPAGEKPEISEVAGYTEQQRPLENRATAYICQNFTCRLPTTEVDKMLKLIE
jgi:hypothetical protein